MEMALALDGGQIANERRMRNAQANAIIQEPTLECGAPAPLSPPRLAAADQSDGKPPQSGSEAP
jgi:hypothetical protein